MSNVYWFVSFGVCGVIADFNGGSVVDGKLRG